MRFRTVILLSIWSVVTGALIVGFVLVNIAMRDHIRSRAASDLVTHRSTLGALFALQLEELGRTAELFAETPRLKAVAELGDPNTVAQLMSELEPGIGADLLVVADRAGRLLFGAAGETPAALPPGLLAADPVPGRPGARTGFVAIDTQVFRAASAPILVGTDPVGRLLLGFRITGSYLATLKELIGSDVALVAGGRLVGATVGDAERPDVARWVAGDRGADPSGDPPEFAAGEERFLSAAVTPAALGPASGGHRVRAVILSPIRRETEAALHPVIRSFALLSGAVLVVTVGVGFFVSRGVTRPIAGLVQGTAEIGRGNYDYEIAVPKGVELRILATRFGEMSAALKEKVSQLGERNRELELALRKLRETQEELIRSERLAATGRLTAQLSHEINNPVHNILSSLQTALKRTPSGAESRELLETAHDEVERLARLTRQLLTAYRESAAAPDPRAPLDLNALLREVASSSAELLRRNSIEVVHSFTGSLPPVLGSSDRLKQLFLNLIVNARDAMPRGGTLTLSTAAGGGTVTATVADTGVGIPAEHLDRIFDAFFTTKGKVSGTGLGLSVSYGIVQQHRGTITVASRPGEGAAFTVSLPTAAGGSA